MKDTAISLNKATLNCILLGVTLSLFGCNSSLNTNHKNASASLNIESCLDSYKKDDLKESLKVCNQVIKKFPNNPIPLNHRSVIYNLYNKGILACEDIKKAKTLIKQNTYDLDPLTKYQMKVRYDYCIK